MYAGLRNFWIVHYTGVCVCVCVYARARVCVHVRVNEKVLIKSNIQHSR